MRNGNNLVSVDPRELLKLDNAELRAELEAMLPKPTYPEHMLGLWAQHPEHGRVLVTEDCPDDDGVVRVAWVVAENVRVTNWEYTNVSELTFQHQVTRPEDVPVGEAWLVDVRDGYCSYTRVVALKLEDGEWRTIGAQTPDECVWTANEVTLIAPLVPATPGPTTTEPEYVETEEEYEALPTGSIVGDYLAPNKRKPEVLWQKLPDGRWWSVNREYTVNLTSERRPVIRRGWGNE